MMIWVRKYTKRFFRQPLFLMLLICLPVGTMLFSYQAQKKSTAVTVGLVWEDTGGIEEEIAERLGEHRGVAVFVRCDSEEELKRRVADGQLTCGYCFGAGMEERLKKGEYKGLIRQYYREGTLLRAIVAETVFAAVYDRYGERIARDYVINSGLYDTYRLSENEIASLYQRQHETRATFHFSYDEGTPAQRSLGDYLTAPLKGGMALLILLSGFCGIIVWLEDKRKGLSVAAPAGVRPFLPYLSAGIPVVVLSVAGIISEMISRFSFLSVKEIACIAIYDIMVIMFVTVFAGSGLSCRTMWGIALCTVFAGAVATPIFVNLSAVIPGIGILSWVCPPAYYLKAVYGGAGAFLFMAVGTALLILLCRYRQKNGGGR